MLTEGLLGVVVVVFAAVVWFHPMRRLFTPWLLLMAGVWVQIGTSLGVLALMDEAARWRNPVGDLAPLAWYVFGLLLALALVECAALRFLDDLGWRRQKVGSR